MIRQSRKSRLFSYAVFVCIFITILLFSFLTPLVADDFSYRFSWVDNRRIESLGQIFSSMAVHRQVTNGRVFAHGIVQFLLMWPKAVFNILNALNALLICLLFSRYLKSRANGNAALLLACGALMLWNFTPSFGQVFLWLDGSVNYSWGISLFLLYIWPYSAAYLGLDHKRSPVRDILFVFFSFIVGAYSENGSIAAIFIALCLCLLIFRRDRRLPWPLLAGLAAACLGFVFLMSAPAVSTRAGEFSLSAIAFNIRHVLLLTKEHMLVPYLIYAAALVLCIALKADRQKILLSIVFVLAGIGSLAAFFFAVHFAPRSFCFAIVFTVLASLLLFDALLENGQKLPSLILCSSMSVLFLFNFVLGALDITVTFGKSLERQAAISAALESGETELALEIYLPSTWYSAPFGLTDLGSDPDQWPNNSLALYYGLDSVTGINPDD